MLLNESPNVMTISCNNDVYNCVGSCQEVRSVCHKTEVTNIAKKTCLAVSRLNFKSLSAAELYVIEGHMFIVLFKY